MPLLKSWVSLKDALCFFSLVLSSRFNVCECNFHPAFGVSGGIHVIPKGKVVCRCV